MAGANEGQALTLELNADTRRALKSIEAFNRRMSGLAPEMQASARKAVRGIENEFGNINVKKALDKVFDSSKLAVIEAGSAKLRVFGSAIEPLGPLGIAAAAGVVALATAFAQSREAIEYADGIYKAAAAAHTTTDALQEMRVAVSKAGGDAASAGPALAEFSANLGKAEAGVPRALRAFRELFGTGFSAADASKLAASGTGLDQVVARIQKLKNPEQQDAIIQQFGLEGLKPLILAGADAWKTWREEAKAAGLVLDSEVIRRGHELNVQMDELTLKIKNDLTTAFVNLGPVLVGLLGLVDKMLSGINKFSGELARDPVFQALVETSLGKSAADAVQHYGTGQIAQFGVSGTLTEAQLQAGLGAPKGNAKLNDVTRGAKNDFSDKAGQAQKEIDKQQEDLAKAQEALTANVQARAELERLGLSKARDQIFDQINEAERRAINDKGITVAQRNQLLAQYELAKTIADQVLGEKTALADRKEAWAIVDKEVALRKYDVSALEAELSADAATAVTAKDRNAFEKRLLAAQQTEAAKELDLKITRGLQDGSLTADDASRLRANQGATFAAQNQQQAVSQENPIQKYARSVQDLTTEVQGDAVSAFQNLTSGLVDAALHAKSLGDVAKNVFLSLIQDVLTQTLQKDALPGLEAGASGLLHILGLAGGGSVRGPGSATSDSIPAMLSDGEYVVKASAASKHRALLDAINGGGVPKLAGGGFVSGPRFPTLDALNSMSAPRAGGVTIVQPFHFHAEGAVLSEDILNQANMTAAQLAANAGRAARAGAVGDVRRAGYLSGVNQ